MTGDSNQEPGTENLPPPTWYNAGNDGLDWLGIRRPALRRPDWRPSGNRTPSCQVPR